MMRTLWDLAIIYSYGSFVGVGPYLLIVPLYLRTPYLSLLLPCGMGLAVVSVVGMYCLLNARPMTDVLVWSFVLGVLAMCIPALIRARGARREPRSPAPLATWAASVRSSIFTRKSFLFLVLLAAILAPVLRANMPTTPFRVGIDQAGYAETSQYLVEHGSVLTIRATLLQRLQTSDFKKAKLQNLKALNLGTYVDSEFLLKALRWGFPAVVGSLTLLTQSRHVFEIEFILLIFNYALLLALIYFVCRACFGITATLAFALTCAFGLNCNVLNVLYEGQLAQIFVLPYFFLIFVVYLFVRTRSARLLPLPIRSYVRPLALFAFMLTTLFCAYNESILLLFGVIIVGIVLDVMFYRRTTLMGLLFLGAGITIGAISAWPISEQWVFYTFRNLSGLSRAGFWQPHWGSFAEILGLFNMYGDLGYALVPRTTFNVVLNIVCSVALALVLSAFLFIRDRADRSFWLAAPLTVAAAYVQMHTLNPILNYPYMKVYTMLLPLLYCGVFGAFVTLAPRRTSRLRLPLILAIALMCSSGLFYLGQYVVEGGYVTRDMLALYPTRGARRFDRYALILSKNHGTLANVRNLMLMPIVSMNWLNADNTPRVIAPYLSDHVALLLASEEIACRSCFMNQFESRIRFKNDSFVLYDTGVTVSQLCVPDAKRYSLTLLGYETTDKWNGLPALQCDYDRFASLQQPWQS